MASSIRLRPYDASGGQADEDFLFRLYATAREEEVSAWGWDQTQQQVFLRMQYKAQRQWYAVAYAGAEHRIILENDQPVGRILVRRAKDSIELVDISLLPEHRNRGIGTALVGELIQESRNSGAVVRLQVLRTNHRAIRLYRRLGFVIASEDEIRYQMELKQSRGES